tara:strand:- start:460 stop:972 length:513 start_codon:yes stop_codon:yes gene_type:complete
MEIKTIKCDFIITKVKSHKRHKKIILDLINKMPETDSEDYSKGDWHLNRDYPREYLDYFYNNVVDSIMNKQMKYFKADRWKILNCWFQQYYDGGFHKFHNHEQTNWTNVYYVELPSSDDLTKIKVNGKLYKYTAKEGDVITFPAHLLHTAPAVNNKRKTVIAFNSNFLYS